MSNLKPLVFNEFYAAANIHASYVVPRSAEVHTVAFMEEEFDMARQYNSVGNIRGQCRKPLPNLRFALWTGMERLE